MKSASQSPVQDLSNVEPAQNELGLFSSEPLLNIDLFEMTDAQWKDGIALKLHGARRLTMRAWDALRASKGAVVLISGSAALDPKPGFGAVATINPAIICARQGLRRAGRQGWSAG